MLGNEDNTLSYIHLYLLSPITTMREAGHIVTGQTVTRQTVTGQTVRKTNCQEDKLSGR